VFRDTLRAKDADPFGTVHEFRIGLTGMCGFVATISAGGQPVDVGLLERMADLVRHRGPDGAGRFVEGPVGLAFRRLAIFDLAPTGEQPMTSADGRYVIVFNGAIYNFIELRAELEALGHTFRSTGDTEVLLTAWREWGPACLPRLNGMWAFLIYDRRERRLFGSRDRFGVKPLFWYRDRTRLVFSSEIKSIRDSGATPLTLDLQTVADQLLNERVDSTERTLYREVQRVPAGTWFEVEPSGDFKWSRYWSLPEAVANAPAPGDPPAAWAELFDDAVRLRMRSDVPVGVLLSGGLDSSSIMCSMARQLGPNGARHSGLFALCYMDPEFDESTYIDANLQQTGGKLERLETGPIALWDALSDHLWHQDEPVHSFSSVVVHQLMKLAHARGIKVVLNGQGADELLAGYRSYFADYWLELARRGRFGSARREIAAFARAHGQPSAGLFPRTLAMLLRQTLHGLPGQAAIARRWRRPAPQRERWVSAEVRRHWQPVTQEPWHSLNEALRSSLERAHLPLYLRTEDRNSMAHGVELRVPFLDYRLVTLAFRLGSEWKIRGEYTKVLMREAMTGRIPDLVRTRVQKFGFPTAVDQWFRGPLLEPLRDLLASRVVRESGLWNLPEVDRDLQRHCRGEANLSDRLFDVAQLSLLVSGVPQPAQVPLRATPAASVLQAR
jgi:asparagine synthase (glutamine-hydrolysing)